MGETFEGERGKLFTNTPGSATTVSRVVLAFYLRGASSKGGRGDVVIHSWSQYAACRVRFLQLEEERGMEGEVASRE